MDRDGLATAAKLLAKAQRTEFESEAISLIEASYRLLAGVLETRDAASAERGVHAEGAPRRERRLRRDRRVSRRVGSLVTPVPGGDPAGSYRRIADELRGRNERGVDLSA